MIGCPDCNVPLAAELSARLADEQTKPDVVTYVVTVADLPGALARHKVVEGCVAPDATDPWPGDELLALLPPVMALPDNPFDPRDVADACQCGTCDAIRHDRHR